MKKIKLGSLLLFFVLCILSGCNRKQKNEIVIGVSMLSLQAEFVVNVKDAM